MSRAKQTFNEFKAERIKESRERKQISRQQLSDMLLNLAINPKYEEFSDISTSISAVKSWEGIGKKYSPDNTTLKAISIVLNVDYDYLLHGTTSDIIEESRCIFESFANNPESWQVDSPNYSDDEVMAVYYSLQMCGYTWEEITDKAQYCEYMAASIRNAIEFYIKNLNKEKENTP